MKITTERFYPFLSGISISAAYLIFFRRFPIPESLCNLLTATVTISAISIGFLATSKTILLSIEERRIIRQIKKMGLYKNLINYLMTAIHYCFILAVVSALGLVINLKNQQWWHPYGFTIWLFISSTSLLLCYRVINIFSKILKAGLINDSPSNLERND